MSGAEEGVNTCLLGQRMKRRQKRTQFGRGFRVDRSSEPQGPWLLPVCQVEAFMLRDCKAHLKL